jgi:hypothetical protein
MDAREQIRSFSRDFINGIGRTAERKKLIASTYRQIFHENLRVSCITCYIEAIFKIIKIVETKKSCNYRLKKGAILQPFGGGIITNDNITDEIAEECLRNHAANPSMFDIMPDAPSDELTIVPPDLGAMDEIAAGNEPKPKTVNRPKSKNKKHRK